MLREAIDAMTMPTRNPCKWSDAVTSSGEGASVRDDTKDVGVETHDGGPSVSEYPDRTLLMLGSVLPPLCWVVWEVLAPSSPNGPNNGPPPPPTPAEVREEDLRAEEVDLVLSIGESVLLEKVSGMT